MFSQLWPITLTVALGMTAIGLLLPRPRRAPVMIGIALGAASFVFLAVLLLSVAHFSIDAVLFYIFAAMTLLSGGFMITQANPARAALAFAVVILSTCGLFLLNAAPFVMASTIIVYAGAIVVTFLFVLMLAQPTGQSNADNRSREPVLATIAGFFLLATLFLVLRQTYGEYDSWLGRVEEARNQPVARVWEVLGDEEEFRQSTDSLMQRVLGHDAAKAITEIVDRKDDIKDVSTPGPGNADAIREWLDRLASAGEQLQPEANRSIGRWPPPAQWGPSRPLALSPFSGTPGNQPVQPISSDNVANIGKSLFSDYLLAVEIGGTLLLIATIGAIAIAHRPPNRRSA